MELYFTFGFLVLMLVACVIGLGLQIYGTILSFKKSWYIGAVALFVPGFALVVGGAKALKMDLLK